MIRRLTMLTLALLSVAACGKRAPLDIPPPPPPPPGQDDGARS